MITVEQLSKLIPRNKNVQQWCDALNAILPEYEINTPQRIAAFLAQTIHESAEFTTLKENLNYKAESLVRVWPKHFESMEVANEYARQPERIANRAYENRMGNGPEESGDGWKFAGKGLIQLTGRNNYEAFAEDSGMNIDDVPEYLLTPEGAVKSACFFWKKNNLNAIADTGNIDKISKIVNGGTIGMAERHAIYDDALTL